MQTKYILVHIISGPIRTIKSLYGSSVIQASEMTGPGGGAGGAGGAGVGGSGGTGGGKDVTKLALNERVSNLPRMCSMP